jgi:hypothetical protein
MANDNLLTPTQELDAISKALAARVKSLSNIKGYKTQASLNKERERRIAATYAWLRRVVEARDVQPSSFDYGDPEKNAVIRIQYMGSIGYYKGPFFFSATDEEVRIKATEEVRNGSIDNITEDPLADFTDFVVERMVVPETLPGGTHNLISLRPKTPF